LINILANFYTLEDIFFIVESHSKLGVNFATKITQRTKKNLLNLPDPIAESKSRSIRLKFIHLTLKTLMMNSQKYTFAKVSQIGNKNDIFVLPIFCTFMSRNRIGRNPIKIANFLQGDKIWS
jgi:hypothetical protein